MTQDAHAHSIAPGGKRMFSWVGTGLHLPLAYIILNLDPILVHLGALAVHWYGLGYVVAIVIGMAVTLRWARNMGIHEDQVWGIFLWTAIAGLIGARLYYVIQQPDLVSHFLLNPINILAVWNGGMAFFGAVFAGALTLLYIAPRYGLNRFLLLDAGAVFALVAQIWGRFGNIINGDILGQAGSVFPITTPAGVCAQAPCIAIVPDGHFLPWDIVYLNPHSFAPLSIPFQPAPVYEMLCNIAAFAILFGLRYKLPRRSPGVFFSLYLAAYAVGQFIVFFFRGSEPFTPFLGIDGLKQAQWTAIFTFLLAIALFVITRRLARPWTFSAKNPVPFPLPAGGIASLSAAAADTAPRLRQPVAVGVGRGATARASQTASAEDTSSRLGAAIKAAEGADALPPWQPAHATHGRLRNTFG